MSGKRYVPEGVYLVCDKGTKPSELKSLSYKETTLFGEHMTTKVDKVLNINFDPFGPCSMMNGSTCTAPITDWTNLTDSVRLGGNELLLENSELPCTLGGKIKIFYSMEDALGACPKPKKGFWATVLGIHKKYEEFKVGVAKGLWKGLKGTVTGIADLAVWAGKHTSIYATLNPQGFAEQIQKDKETLKSLGNLAKKGGKWAYRNSAINLITNPNDYVAAQAENKVMMDKLIEKAKTMDAEDWGMLTGEIGFEIILEVVTAGGAAALTTLKVADKTVDAARALDKLDDLADTAKGLEKIKDGPSLPSGPIELDDVKYLDDVPTKKPTFKHGESDGGPGTWQKETTPPKGAEYQEKVTGAPKDTEYVVKTDIMKRGKKKFDGYDPETNTLTDAKDWDGWPPEGQQWAEDKVAKIAQDDLDIANQVGSNLEYHVPTQAKADQLNRIFGDRGLDDIKVVVTPK